MWIFLEIVYVSISTYVYTSRCDEIMIIIIPTATRCSNSFSWGIRIPPLIWNDNFIKKTFSYVFTSISGSFHFISSVWRPIHMPLPHCLNSCRQTYNAFQFSPTVIPPPLLFFFRDSKEILNSFFLSFYFFGNSFLDLQKPNHDFPAPVCSQEPAIGQICPTSDFNWVK